MADAQTERPAWRTWLGRFAVLGVLLGCWAVATPDFSGPDEQAHVLRAAAVAGGDIGTRSDPGLNQGESIVEDVPRSLTLGTPIAVCYVFNPTTTPCGPPFVEDDEQVDAITTAGIAPPFFYGLVGTPLRVMPDSGGLLLSRLIHVAICAALLATAAVMARRARQNAFLLLGLAVAATPMAFYLSGIINPSGVEVSAAIAMWVLLLVTASAERPPPRAVAAAMAAAGTALVLSRALSAAFFLGMVVITVVALGWKAFDLRSRRLQAAGGVIALAFVPALAWVVTHDPTQVVPAAIIPPATEFQAFLATVGKTEGNLQQMVASFGWLDTPSPSGVHFAWLFAGALLLLLALTLTRSVRARVALGLLVAGAIALPLLVEFPGYHDYGLIFQGRYGLPIMAGVPLLSGILLDRAGPSVRAVLDPIRTPLLVVLWIAHGAAFWFYLRRYTMGADASVLIPLHPEWSPRLHPWVLMLIATVASAEWARWLGRSAAVLDDLVADPRPEVVPAT